MLELSIVLDVRGWMPMKTWDACSRSPGGSKLAGVSAPRIKSFFANLVMSAPTAGWGCRAMQWVSTPWERDKQETKVGWTMMYMVQPTMWVFWWKMILYCVWKQESAHNPLLLFSQPTHAYGRWELTHRGLIQMSHFKSFRLTIAKDTTGETMMIIRSTLYVFLTCNSVDHPWSRELMTTSLIKHK